MIIYHRTPFKVRNKVKYIDVIATDLIDNENWTSYLQQNVYNKVFFDNAVFEQQPLPTKQYIEYVLAIRPERWVLPDVFNNIEHTLHIGVELVNVLPVDIVRRAIVVVCKLPTEYTLLTRIIDSGVSTIGVPYVPNIDRFHIVKSLIEYYPKIQIHLLGVQFPSELCLYVKYKNVKSADTGLALTTTKKRLRLSKGEFHKEIIKSLEEYNDVDEDLFLENVEYLNTIIQ